jgi:hypothetical protein
MDTPTLAEPFAPLPVETAADPAAAASPAARGANATPLAGAADTAAPGANATPLAGDSTSAAPARVSTAQRLARLRDWLLAGRTLDSIIKKAGKAFGVRPNRVLRDLETIQALWRQRCPGEDLRSYLWFARLQRDRFIGKGLRRLKKCEKIEHELRLRGMVHRAMNERDAIMLRIEALSNPAAGDAGDDAGDEPASPAGARPGPRQVRRAGRLRSQAEPSMGSRRKAGTFELQAELPTASEPSRAQDEPPQPRKASAKARASADKDIPKEIKPETEAAPPAPQPAALTAALVAPASPQDESKPAAAAPLPSENGSASAIKHPRLRGRKRRRYWAKLQAQQALAANAEAPNGPKWPTENSAPAHAAATLVPLAGAL